MFKYLAFFLLAVATLFLSDVPKVDLGVMEFFHETNSFFLEKIACFRGKSSGGTFILRKTGYCNAKMKKIPAILKIFCAAGLLAAAGCGDNAPRGASPTERNRLLIRLFTSMEKRDPASAAAQAAKVRTLDPGNSYFAWIIEQQECNRAALDAQRALDADDLEKAGELLSAARKRHPLNHAAAEDLQKVRDLVALRQAVRAFRAAGTPADREQALKIIFPLAEKLRDPALSAAVAEERKRLTAAVPKPSGVQKPKPQ